MILKTGSDTSPVLTQEISLIENTDGFVAPIFNFNKVDTKIITETSEVEKEYENEVTSLTKDTSNE